MSARALEEQIAEAIEIANNMEARWLVECRRNNRVLALVKASRVPWPTLVECPWCKRMQKMTRNGICVHRRRDDHGHTPKCPGSKRRPERRLPESLDLDLITAILEGKEAPMTPNEFFAACESMGNRLPITPEEAQPFVDWYLKQDGNASGGTLSSLLADGNYSTEFVSNAYLWARESGDWLGAALACVIRGIPEAQRKKIKGAEPTRKRARR